MVTIAIIGDAHTTETSDRVAQLTSDLNNMISLSPTGQVDTILTTGDMETVTKFDQAHKASNVSNVALYYTIGNHDVDNLDNVKSLQPKELVNPGPPGTEKTSFSFNVGDIHIVILNVYWDGNTNEGWMGGGIDGGEVVPKLLTWLQTDLASTTTPYKIVLAHEPMYPDQRHNGNSLDWNIPARDALQKVLNDNNVDAFIAGHTHFADGLKVGNLLQVQTGVPGTKAGTNGDDYRSMWFVHIAPNGDMIITWKHNANSGSSWTNPTVKTWTFPQDGTTPPIESSSSPLPLLVIAAVAGYLIINKKKVTS